MTREEKIQRGIEAATLLEDAAFNYFISDELDRIKTASFNTMPNEEAIRTEMYYRHLGIMEFVGSLTAHRDTAVELLREEDN